MSWDTHADSEAGERFDTSLARFRAAASCRILAKKASRATVAPPIESQSPVTRDTHPSGQVRQGFARWFLPSNWFFRKPYR